MVAVFIAFLWVPNGVFINYAEASKYLSILFMVLQVCIVIIYEGDNIDRLVLPGRDQNGEAL